MSQSNCSTVAANRVANRIVCKHDANKTIICACFGFITKINGEHGSPLQTIPHFHNIK